MKLPADVREYPEAIAQALSHLRVVGVNGPDSVLLGADAYIALAETSGHGYPVLEHVKRFVEDKIIWAPAIAGAFVLTTRGGDFDLHIGQDLSIGYLSHTDAAVRLYLQDTFTFLLLTSEAAVARMDRVAGRVYNIGDGPRNTLSLIEPVGLVRGMEGRPLEHSFGDWRPGDQRVYISDIRKAGLEFDWTPRVPPEEGVRMLRDWMAAHRELIERVYRAQ